MADFDLAIGPTLQWEGGYSNNPNDPGGETNFGISKRSYPSLNIRDLTRNQACAIYRRDFWQYDGIDSQSVANKLFDTGVNLGISRAVFFVQGLVGVQIDGRYGPHTEGGINGSDPDSLLQAYRDRLAQYYKDLVVAHPQFQRFLGGWLRRAES